VITADDFPLRVGDTAARTRVFTTEDLVEYRRLTGDAGLRFGNGDPGVPGPLLAGMISDLLGTSLPGLGTMWMKQTLEYSGAAPLGSEVTAAVTITRLRPEKNLVNLRAECSCGEDQVLAGDTLVQVPNLGDRTGH
jgi:hypothetical protein